jgi:HEAT repeat protein
VSFLQTLFGPPDVERLERKRNIRGLIKALTYPKDPHVRAHAAKVLGKVIDRIDLGPTHPVIGLLQLFWIHIAPRHDRKRREKVEKALASALWDSDGGVRASAADALAQLSSRLLIEEINRMRKVQAVESLISLLGNEAAATALTEIGAPAVEELISAMNDRYWARWASADRRSIVVRHVYYGRLEPPLHKIVEVLGRIGDTRAVDPLIALLKERRRDIHKEVAEALGRIGDKRAVEPLIEALDWGEVLFGSAAALALGEIGDARAVQPLTKALESEYKCAGAAAALRKLGAQLKDPTLPARAVRPLITHLSSRGCSTEVEVAVAEELGRIGAESEDAGLRRLAVESLITYLIERRGVSKTSFAVARALEAITRCTSFGANPRAWQRWWEKRKKSFR